MYWADSANSIWSANLDGTGFNTLFATSEAAVGIDIDTMNSNVYWTESNAIYRGDLSNGTKSLILDGVGVNVFDIELDVASGKMYWVVFSGAGKIQRANLDGTEVETILDGLTEPITMALDLDGQKLYWAERNAITYGSIHRADLNGSNPELLLSGLGLGVRDLELGPQFLPISSSVVPEHSSAATWLLVMACIGAAIRYIRVQPMPSAAAGRPGRAV
jgi:hypothetical protein